jgi:hypothetical protein
MVAVVVITDSSNGTSGMLLKVVNVNTGERQLNMYGLC